jgi:hypothetical protein
LTCHIARDRAVAEGRDVANRESLGRRDEGEHVDADQDEGDEREAAMRVDVLDGDQR